MIDTFYTGPQRTEDNRRIFQLLRAKSVQEAINLIGITDPPRNFSEYRLAALVFRNHIEHNQPRSMQNLPPEQKCKVEPYDGSAVNARGAIHQWVYLTILDAAMQEASSQPNFQITISLLVGLFETSCQFDDDLFSMGIKLTFAVGALLLRIPQAREPLNQAMWHFMGLFNAEKVEPRILSHGSEPYDLSTDLFLLMHFLSSYPIPFNTAPRKHFAEIGVDLNSAAQAFDRKTNSIYQLDQWVNGVLDLR